MVVVFTREPIGDDKYKKWVMVMMSENKSEKIYAFIKKKVA
jgi:hypothetical protein